MNGLYIHIPFCAQSCHYCDFHFSTNQQLKSEMVSMICREIELRKDYLSNKNLHTIYFGGGTPSILSTNEIESILNTISKNFILSKDIEITFESNPDDLNIGNIQSLKSLGINRLSIGIQTFDEANLKFLNRIHSANDAIDSVKNAQKLGFENITIDLIYGIHSDDHLKWQKDLNTALDLNVPHISSYCLTIEPGTVFGNWSKKKILKEADDEFSAYQFEMLMDQTANAGFEQYEISNFSLPKMHSKHNSNYWLGGHYLGVGPSAHSYNGQSRQYNISNNSLYIRSIKEGNIPYEIETLSAIDVFNETLMTGLRTKWGFNFGLFEKENKTPISFAREQLVRLIQEGYILNTNGILTLSRKGKFIADKITLDLFV